MNKPAAKEPSMDEILSSIRQIIADEDQVPSQPAAAHQPVEAAPRPEPVAEAAPAEPETDEALQNAEVTPAYPEADVDLQDAEEEPLTLSADQLVRDNLPEAESEDGLPEFNPANEAEAEETESVAEAAPMPQPEDEEDAGIVLPDDIAFGADEETDEPALAGESAGRSAPMPDPHLSSDMAEKLLEPTTAAATRHAFSRLNSLSVGGEDITLESMVREMLRPMLKEWLDENLPSVVEKLVEREIERISRGG